MKSRDVGSTGRGRFPAEDLGILHECLTRSQASLAISDRERRYLWIYDARPDFDGTDAIGRTDLELEDNPGMRELFALKGRVLSSGAPETAEIELPVAGAATRVYAISAAPLVDAEGSVWGVSTVAHDVTQRRSNERAHGRLRDDHLRLVSHDLRQPLAVIELAAEVVSRVSTSPALEAAGSRIKSNVRAIAATFEDILELDAQASGTLTLRRERTDLGLLVRDAAETTVAPDQLARVQVRAPVSCEAYVDRIKLRRAIANLLDNALKFSPPGEPIDVEIAADAGRVTVCVQDRGPGVDATTGARLFDEHWASATSRASGGRGLGLYSARLFIEAHGGVLTVQSTPDRGARFVITLPER